MKVCFWTLFQDYWGGSEELWVRSATAFLEANHQVQVIFYADAGKIHPSIRMLLERGAIPVQLPLEFGHRSIGRKITEKIKSAYRQPASVAAISAFNPDLIIVNQPHTYSAPFYKPAYSLLSNSGKPFYLITQFNSEHGCLSYDEVLKSRAVFAAAKAIYFVSKRNHQVAERQIAASIPNHRFIDNPLNLQQLDYITYPAANDLFELASVARMEVNYKGQDILFQILAEKIWTERNWRLNLYGTGRDEKYLHALAKHYNIHQRVVFHGQVASIADVWKANHILLMPSIAEGKPLALQEAMICGRTAIVSDVAGNAELIDNNVNGFLASSYFVEPFAEAMERAWLKRMDWAAWGILARKKALACLDLQPEITLLNQIVSDMEKKTT